MHKSFTYGSVCSGIEAASVAWEPLGLAPAWFSQFDPDHNYNKGPDFPSLVLANHWPDVPNLGDMTKIAAGVRAGQVSAPDIMVGGTPCQAFSVAGTRKGLSDGRGRLTISYGELADAIDDARIADGKPPTILVWENVPGVLSSKDNAFGAFLGLLAGEDCELQPPGGKWKNAGFVLGPKRTIAWRVLDAQYFGVAQRRRRVFVVASARTDFDPRKVLFESEGVRRDIAPSRKTREEVTAAIGGSIKIGSHWDSALNPHPTLNQAHNTGGIGASNQEIFSQRSSGIVGAYRMTAFGEYADDETASTCKARDYKDATDLVTMVGALDTECGYESQTLQSVMAGHVIAVHGTQDPDTLRDMAHTLGRNHGAENAISYGIPGNWIGRAPKNGGNATEPMHDISPCLTVADRHGVAVTTQLGYEIAGTLTARHDSSPCADRGQNMVASTKMAIRRLTPVECERLQGFPDGWTLIPTEKKKKITEEEYRYRRHHSPNMTAEQAHKMASDGPRYKAIGNSMAVPVMRWIGIRLLKELGGTVSKALEALVRKYGETPCRLCDGTLFMYGDESVGPCPCTQHVKMYGYWLHQESGCGGIYHNQYDRDIILMEPLCEPCSFAQYKQCKAEGYDLEWTENEEL